ncbi:hypothetical protein LEP1GSC170_3755 [Leptospira interrogans serovar Bataviae str. HAI135]|nr:hypothetical protein LEP1GSC170_3755 [Leptospira interrogans serovar Bataviae str. HAI135]
MVVPTILKLVRKIVICRCSHISGIQIPTFFRTTSIFVELMLSTLELLKNSIATASIYRFH